jgi:hypothetical protein
VALNAILPSAHVCLDSSLQQFPVVSAKSDAWQFVPAHVAPSASIPSLHSVSNAFLPIMHVCLDNASLQQFPLVSAKSDAWQVVPAQIGVPSASTPSWHSNDFLPSAHDSSADAMKFAIQTYNNMYVNIRWGNI